VFGNLAGDKAAPGVPSAPPILADKLTFTTALNISAAPKVEFTPVTTAFQLADASLNASVARTDVHEVSVGLALPSTIMADLEPLRSFVFSPGRGAGITGRAASVLSASSAPALYVGARVTGGGSLAERLAVVAIDQLKSRQVQFVAPP
jgi:hypothetical protein